MAEWQDISTAPKDGSEILAWMTLHQNGCVAVAHYDPDAFAAKPRPHWGVYGWMWGKSALRESQPTHWMPLPEAPK